MVKIYVGDNKGLDRLLLTQHNAKLLATYWSPNKRTNKRNTDENTLNTQQKDSRLPKHATKCKLPHHMQ